MSKFIKDTKKYTLEAFFSGHTQPEAGDEQNYESFSIELQDFCIWFFEKFGSESDRLLSEFLSTCRTDYEKQLQESKTQFDCPLVWHDNCLYNSPIDRDFVVKYGGFDKIDEHLELAAEKLTDAINEELDLTKASWLTGILKAAISIYKITHKLGSNNGNQLDIRLFLNSKQPVRSQSQRSCFVMLKEQLGLDSQKAAKDLFAVFLITSYETKLTSTAYKFSSKSEYTRRHIHGIQGAYNKIANALTAIDRASNNSSESEEDAVNHLNDISADYAGILNMTPVSGHTEEESS